MVCIATAHPVNQDSGAHLPESPTQNVEPRRPRARAKRGRRTRRARFRSPRTAQLIQCSPRQASARPRSRGPAFSAADMWY